MYNAYARDDEHDEPLGADWKDRIRGWFSWRGQASDFDEDDGFEEAAPTTTRSTATASSPLPLETLSPTTSAGMTTTRTASTTYRLSTVRDGSITILPATTYDDVQRAADRLKQGEPQILNLERVSPETADRMIDFLYGTIYALDGDVEKIAERAYLFTPANVLIHSDRPGESAGRVLSRENL